MSVYNNVIFNSTTNRSRRGRFFYFNRRPRVTLAVCIIIFLLLLSRYYTILVRLIVRVEFNPKLIHRLWRVRRREEIPCTAPAVRILRNLQIKRPPAALRPIVQHIIVRRRNDRYNNNIYVTRPFWRDSLNAIVSLLQR